jgi:hypothetical protein
VFFFPFGRVGFCFCIHLEGRKRRKGFGGEVGMVRSHLATHTLLLLHLLDIFYTVCFFVVVVVATCYCSSLFFFFLVFSVCIIFVVVGFFRGILCGRWVDL